jgi:hypothetical protein
MRWIIVLSLSGELYISTDLESKKALLETRQDIKYNSYTNNVIYVTTNISLTLLLVVAVVT